MEHDTAGRATEASGNLSRSTASLAFTQNDIRLGAQPTSAIVAMTSDIYALGREETD